MAGSSCRNTGPCWRVRSYRAPRRTSAARRSRGRARRGSRRRGGTTAAERSCRRRRRRAPTRAERVRDCGRGRRRGRCARSRSTGTARARCADPSYPRRSRAASVRWSARSPTCQSPVPAELETTCEPRPVASAIRRKTTSAMGERQMLPLQTNTTRKGGRDSQSSLHHGGDAPPAHQRRSRSSRAAAGTGRPAAR